QVRVCLPALVVARLTPGPVRWKLSAAERSLTRTTTGPAASEETLTVAPTRVSAIRLPGPTEPASWTGLAAGGLGAGEGGAVPTVKLPNMTVEWGSHWKWYEPSVNVTVQVTVPVCSTSVAWSTPGPVRWKSCWADR